MKYSEEQKDLDESLDLMGLSRDDVFEEYVRLNKNPNYESAIVARLSKKYHLTRYEIKLVVDGQMLSR